MPNDERPPTGHYLKANSCKRLSRVGLLSTPFNRKRLCLTEQQNNLLIYKCTVEAQATMSDPQYMHTHHTLQHAHHMTHTYIMEKLITLHHTQSDTESYNNTLVFQQSDLHTKSHIMIMAISTLPTKHSHSHTAPTPQKNV